MSRPSLDDAQDKLRWGRKHFESVRGQIEAFEKRDNHSITVDIDADAGEYVFHVHGLEPPDPDWGLVIGDCLHNARTALDHLMVNLTAIATAEDPRDITNVQFPIYDSPKRFAGAVADMRKHPLLSGYLARIEELQTFNVGNPSIWGWDDGLPMIHPLPGAIDRLGVLDNIDKHRAIHVTWVGIDFLQAYTGGSDRAIWPTGFEPRSGSHTYQGPLTNEAKIGSWSFKTPLPSDWTPSQVEMKRCFPLQVSIDEPSPVKRVLEIVPWCVWGAESVLQLFRPVFYDGQPPLPVTVIQPLGYPL